MITDRLGSIRDANGMAGVLLNLSVRYLWGRRLLVHTENRNVFQRSPCSAEQRPGPEGTVLKIRLIGSVQTSVPTHFGS
jgi:hypothetical protein